MVLLQTPAISALEKFWLWLNMQDQILFIYINRILTNSFLDGLFPIWRESITWYPLYLFLLVFAILNLKHKAWLWVLFLIITVVLTDQISSSFVKNYFNRSRPCSDPVFINYVRLLMNRCPSSGSFTSSHATNHFGAAVFLSITLKEYFKNWRYLFFLWAATICYGQVYVGIHYPTDVLGGALLGSLIGYASANFFNRRIGPLHQAESLRTTSSVGKVDRDASEI
jgi:undecaprenyl-diphosphatase